MKASKIVKPIWFEVYRLTGGLVDETEAALNRPLTSANHFSLATWEWLIHGSIEEAKWFEEGRRALSINLIRLAFVLNDPGCLGVRAAKAIQSSAARQQFVQRSAQEALKLKKQHGIAGSF